MRPRVAKVPNQLKLSAQPQADDSGIACVPIAIFWLSSESKVQRHTFCLADLAVIFARIGYARRMQDSAYIRKVSESSTFLDVSIPRNNVPDRI